MGRAHLKLPPVVAASVALAAWLSSAGCDSCTYATRMFWDSSCRSVGGPRTLVSPLPRPSTVAPATTSTSFSVKLSVSCAPGSASLCNHYSDHAPYFAVLLPQDQNTPPTYTAPSTGTVYSSCAAFWNDFQTNPNPPFAATDILGVFIGDTLSNFVACSDAGGCSAGGQFLTNFNPASSFRTDGQGITVSAGTYMLCAFIDAWNLPNDQVSGFLGFPYPVGPGSMPFNSYGFLTLGCEVDQNCSAPGFPWAPPTGISCIDTDTCTGGPVGTPIAGTAASPFITVNVSANTGINLNQWADSP